MRKNHVLVFLVCCVIVLCGDFSQISAQNTSLVQPQEKFTTEGYAFATLTSSYTAGLWPFVISESTDFLARYPFSVHKNEVLFYTGESFFYMEQFDAALAIFENLLGSETVLGKKAQYWVGRIFSLQGEHSSALENLYPLVQNPFEDAQLNKDVLFYSARSLSALRRHEELTVVIEYYIKNYATSSAPSEIIPLLGNLWLGMGIDAFEQEKFDESQEYFRRADLQKVSGESIASQLELSGLYQAIIQYVQGRPIMDAISLLESRMSAGGALELEYLSFLSHLYGESQQWDLCEKYSAMAWELVTTSDRFMDRETPITSTTFAFLQKGAYWYAVCLFKKDDYSKAAQVLKGLDDIATGLGSEKNLLDNFTQLLYAQTLYLSGKSQDALAIFIDLFPDSSETAKALFLSGQWAAAEESARLAGNTYLQGLAAFQSRDWALAANLLLDVNAQDSPEDTSWALYYGGLAQYHRGEYGSCYRTMEEFLALNNFSRYIWDAYMVSAICAIQQGRIESALEKSLAAIQSAQTQAQRESSIVFSAGLYMEQKQYTKATSLLKEFSIAHGPNSIGPRLLLAQSYASANDLATADAELKKILTLFPNEIQAREAAFKRGELQFEAGNYGEAENFFREFRLDFPVGTYSDTALYYEAQCRQNQGDISGSLLLYTDLVKRYPNSSYRFASLSYLIDLYREEDEYANALQIALQTKEEYPLEFSGANLSSQIVELDVLVSGTDEQLAETLFRWQKIGENTNTEGRKTGFDLASLYLASSELNKAYEILVNLDSLLSENADESALHGDVLEKLGQIEREKENCAKAARYYLKAAERITFAGGAQASEDSAKVLYGAIEAFDCAGDTADARAVYQEMAIKHEYSIWTDRATLLLKLEN